MKTREECIAALQKDLDEMRADLRDKVIASCACGEHEFSPRQLLEAVKDPNNEDGRRYYEAWAKVEDYVVNRPDSWPSDSRR
jgi:hypothetical protein